MSYVQSFIEMQWWARDGLSLYARRYESWMPRAPTVLCLHGLTRNAADFDGLARHLRSRYDVLCPDQRGRGGSARDPQPANYNVATQTQDMLELLNQLVIGRVAVIGTSMGGLMAMMMAMSRPARIAGIVLNDVGPEVDPRGIARITSYVGKPVAISNWDDAIAATRSIFASAFPDYSDADWHRLALTTFREDAAGIPRLDYDPAIAQALARPGAAAPPDLWPLFHSLAAIPMLVVRGALSDLLSEDTVEKMRCAHPGLQVCTVANRGHAPSLDEPQAVAAIDEFLNEVLSG